MSSYPNHENNIKKLMTFGLDMEGFIDTEGSAYDSWNADELVEIVEACVTHISEQQEKLMALTAHVDYLTEELVSANHDIALLSYSTSAYHKLPAPKPAKEEARKKTLASLQDAPDFLEELKSKVIKGALGDFSKDEQKTVIDTLSNRMVALNCISSSILDAKKKSKHLLEHETLVNASCKLQVLFKAHDKIKAGG